MFDNNYLFAGLKQENINCLELSKCNDTLFVGIISIEYTLLCVSRLSVFSCSFIYPS